MMNHGYQTEKSCNFLINAANQANLGASINVTSLQSNSILVLIEPYYIERFTIEGLNIDLKADINGNIWVNNQKFTPIEVSPGIRVLGIIQSEER
jgi:hypothetical protein